MSASPVAFAACGVITLTTDFGRRDPCVGVMKGQVLRRLPQARLVDLTHDIEAHCPDVAGFWLGRSFEYFPAGTVHVAVVDPGVGSARAIVAAELAAGRLTPADLGPVVPELQPGNLPEPVTADAGWAGGHEFALVRTYADIPPGRFAALVNSFGVLEIAGAGQSAAAGLGLGRGAVVTLESKSVG